jgi:2-(1,2-epoxy-1,2-dihydrophenyl)acetyl-CoA isomerase
VGAGLGLALACDLRLASAGATFGATFHRVGLTADFGVLHLLPRAIGPARATELLLLGDLVDAARAEQLGLVHAVHAPDRLDEAVAQLAARLADAPTAALALTKAGLERTFELSLPAMLSSVPAANIT